MGLRLAIGDILVGVPFLTFFPATTLAAFVCGPGPGIVCALIGGLLADYFLMIPHGFGLAWPSGWISMGFYVFTNGIIIILTAGMQKAIASLEASEAALEKRVAQRTAALAVEMEERSHAEDALRQMQKMDAIGQLAGGIAHDFNNMLSVILASIHRARRKLTDAEQESVSNYLDMASQAAERSAALVSQLLTFSRQQPLRPVSLDLNAKMAGITELLRHSLDPSIRIELALAAQSCPCEVDPAQLENALLNVAINARDAMPDGGILTIATGGAVMGPDACPDLAPGEYVFVSVSDTGSGMSEVVAARAFDPFFTTKGIGKGTGLGLSQVHGFVRQSGGGVALTSAPGRGTVVKLLLPRADQDGGREKVPAGAQLS